MIDRLELVHAAVERMVDAWMVELDQFVGQNLLTLDCNKWLFHRVIPANLSSSYALRLKS